MNISHCYYFKTGKKTGNVFLLLGEKASHSRAVEESERATEAEV